MTDPSADRPASPLTLRSSSGGEAVPYSTAATPQGGASEPAVGGPVGNFWAEVGGRATFERLVRAFYAGVASDPPLLALYPEADLEPAIQRLTGFLEQYWGGPTTYSEERGHPRLRMRHQPFKVNPAQRDRWLTHMRAAVDAIELPPIYEAELWAYLERAAFAMVNTFED